MGKGAVRGGRSRLKSFVAGGGNLTFASGFFREATCLRLEVSEWTLAAEKRCAQRCFCQEL